MKDTEKLQHKIKCQIHKWLKLKSQDPSTPSYCSSQPASKVMRRFPPSSQTIDHLKENVARCCYGNAKFAWAGLIARNNLNLKCESLESSGSFLTIVKILMVVGCLRIRTGIECYGGWQLFATQHTPPRFRVDFQLGNTYEIEVVTCSKHTMHVSLTINCWNKSAPIVDFTCSFTDVNSFTNTWKQRELVLLRS